MKHACSNTTYMVDASSQAPSQFLKLSYVLVVAGLRRSGAPSNPELRIRLYSVFRSFSIDGTGNIKGH